MIIVDSREKPKATRHILKHFDDNNIEYDISKLYVGDYQRYDQPHIIIDRKQNLNEVAVNCGKDHDRFKRELERLDAIKAKMYLLICQEKIDGNPIESIEDIILWRNYYGELQGERIYRILNSWLNKHDIEYVFCKPSDAGAEIVRLLNAG